ncbi:septum formation initiator family protein [Patescibacteria group bacterium]
MSNSKKAFSYLFIIFALGLIVNLAKDAWRLMHGDERIKKTEDKLVKIREENKSLQDQFDQRQQEAYLEEEIRNKLQMAKPGETIVILPEELVKESSEESELLKDLEDKEKTLANWQKWLQLFL